MALLNARVAKLVRSCLFACRLLVGEREGLLPGFRLFLPAILSGLVLAMETHAGFLTAPSYPAGTWPWTVAVADFNGDGISDLALANQGQDVVNNAGVSIL